MFCSIFRETDVYPVFFFVICFFISGGLWFRDLKSIILQANSS